MSLKQIQVSFDRQLVSLELNFPNGSMKVTISPFSATVISFDIHHGSLVLTREQEDALRRFMMLSDWVEKENSLMIDASQLFGMAIEISEGKGRFA